jgi:hypothetical protein
VQDSKTDSAAETLPQGLGNKTISHIPQKTLLLEAGKAEKEIISPRRTHLAYVV